MRRALLVAAVVSLVLASPASAAASEPQLQIVPADQTWAESILLTSTDLGAAWQSLPGSSGGDPRENSICAEPGPDESDLTITAGGTSDFVRADGGALVASTATIWQTAEQAQADWDRTIQPSLLTCVAADLASASTKKIKLVVTAKRELAYSAVAPRTAAYRFSIVYKTTVKIKKRRKTRSAPATFDLVVLGNGRATAWLATLSFNRTPLSDSSKQALASMLAKRMVTDPGASP
jgi:hypothetical protein